MIISITPIPKPRMVRSDSWRQRPCVLRYWAYKDGLNEKVSDKDWLIKKLLGGTCEIEFYLPMPKSWSEKKKHSMAGEPHQQKPDIDNMLKAFLDCLMTEDSGVWKISCAKYWAFEGKIIIT